MWCAPVPARLLTLPSSAPLSHPAAQDLSSCHHSGDNVCNNILTAHRLLKYCFFVKNQIRSHRFEICSYKFCESANLTKSLCNTHMGTCPLLPSWERERAEAARGFTDTNQTSTLTPHSLRWSGRDWLLSYGDITNHYHMKQPPHPRPLTRHSMRGNLSYGNFFRNRGCVQLLLRRTIF